MTAKFNLKNTIASNKWEYIKFQNFKVAKLL